MIPDNERRPITVVGSINMDMVSTTASLPSAGETVLGSRFELHPGGKGANQAVAIARLDYPVRMLGMVGSDLFGEQLLTHLRNVGVDVTGVNTVEGSSGTASITVVPGGENCIVVTPAANLALSPAYLDAHSAIIREASLVLTQLEIPMETVEHLAELCFQYNVPLILEPAPARDLSQKLLGRIRWCTPNETEAAFFLHSLTPGASKCTPVDQAKSLLRMGPRGVILKMGSRGAYLKSDVDDLQSEVIAVNAIDTTAAGDAFNGAFAVGIASAASVASSLRFAITAASISVTRHGAQPSMPTLSEVEQMMARSL